MVYIVSAGLPERRFAMKAVWKKIGKIALIVLISLLALILLAWGGLNLVKFALFGE